MIARKFLAPMLAAMTLGVPAGWAQDYDCLQGLVPEQFQRDVRSPTDLGATWAGSFADEGSPIFTALFDTGGAPDVRAVMRVAIAGDNPEGPAATILCYQAFDVSQLDGLVVGFRVVVGDRTSADGRPLFDLRAQGGEPLPDGNYFFGMELALVEGGQIVPDAFDGNNHVFSPQGQFVGARFQARFSSATLADDGTLNVAFNGSNSGSAPTGPLGLVWISGDELHTPGQTDGLAAGETRAFEQAFENPGETVRFRVVRADPQQLLFDETFNLPVSAGGPDPDGDGDGDDDDTNDPPTEGVDLAIAGVSLESQGEGFYDLVVAVVNDGTLEATSTPAVSASIPNVNLGDPDAEPVAAGANGGGLVVGEEAEVRFSLNLGTDPDARPEIVSGSVTVAVADEDQDPSNNSQGFELEVPGDGSETEEPAPPVVELVEFGVRDEPPTEYGEPGTLRLLYTLRNQGAAGTRYEVDFNADGEGESLVAKLEANGATLDQGEAESGGSPLPAGPGTVFASGSLRFVVPEEAWDQAYEGVLVVRAYYEDGDGEEILVEPVSRFEIGAKLPEYPKPDLKVQLMVNGAQNPEAFRPSVGSSLQFTVRAVNVGRVAVDGEIGVQLVGSLLGETVVEVTREGGLGLGDAVEESSPPRTVDCDEVARIEEAEEAAIRGAAWLAVDAPREADVRPADNTRRVPLQAPENDCGEVVDPEPDPDPGPCDDGDRTTLCPICDDGDLSTVCPPGEINRDRLRPESDCDDPETTRTEFCE